MEQIQTAKLILKTKILPLNGSNSNGSMDQYRRVMTWNNINLRLLLGDMYDKFDNFNLQLVNIGSNDNRTTNNGTLFQAGTDANDRINTIYMSGMNFLNATYDSYTNNIGTESALTTYEFYKEFSRDIQGSVFTFTKGNEVCNIKIEYKTVNNDSFPATSEPFPNMVFIFNIYGIPREIKKLN